MSTLVFRRDPHRYVTELAEQYGPVFKLRILLFHVRIWRQVHAGLTCKCLFCSQCGLPGLKTSVSTLCCVASCLLAPAETIAVHTATKPISHLCELQVVCITDPILASEVLWSRLVDKPRFLYSFLDPVRPSHMLRCQDEMNMAFSHACQSPDIYSSLWYKTSVPRGRNQQAASVS